MILFPHRRWKGKKNGNGKLVRMREVGTRVGSRNASGKSERKREVGTRVESRNTSENQNAKEKSEHEREERQKNIYHLFKNYDPVFHVCIISSLYIYCRFYRKCAVQYSILNSIRGKNNKPISSLTVEKVLHGQRFPLSN